MKTRKGTCDGCGKVRKLTHPERKTGIVGPGEEVSYYGLCSECFPKVKTQADIIKLRKARDPRERKPRFAYPCIGGPLDGEYATTDDFEKPTDEKYRGNSWFREGGMYGHLADDYAEFNNSRGGRKVIGGEPSMVFIHRALLKPLVAPRNR
jgi:hypothetical protein